MPVTPQAGAGPHRRRSAAEKGRGPLFLHRGECPARAGEKDGFPPLRSRNDLPPALGSNTCRRPDRPAQIAPARKSARQTDRVWSVARWPDPKRAAPCDMLDVPLRRLNPEAPQRTSDVIMRQRGSSTPNTNRPGCAGLGVRVTGDCGLPANPAKRDPVLLRPV